jgi:oligoribonuclease NrnB/cAMP/cGMP phosphodiesterase (DHH superfamily)
VVRKIELSISAPGGSGQTTTQNKEHDMSEEKTTKAKRTVYCYYHRIDLDGHCSAAIVQHWAEEEGYNFVGIGVDHPDGVTPFETFPGVRGFDIGVMVDFRAPTREIMYELNKHFCNLIWIDHHKSSIEMMQGGETQLEGLRRIGDAACELCLEYFFPCMENQAVTLLGRYDVWDNSGKVADWEGEIMPFQLAMRMEMGATLEDDTIPWHIMFDGTFAENYVDAMKGIGRTIYRYDQSLRKTDQRNAYRTRWNGIKCVCINSSLGGSRTLDAIAEKDEMMVTWRFNGEQWVIGLYSHPDSDIDCSKIAKEQEGGGGHRNAAGFCLPVHWNPAAVWEPDSL